MKICIAGKNNIAVWGLKYLLESGIAKKDILVLPNSDDNGLNSWQPSLLKCAKDLGLTTVCLEDVYAIEKLLFISLEFNQIVRPKNFKTKQLFNIHFSNLPKYRGVYTSIMPLLYGEEKSGVTLHEIDEGIDTGDIIAQKLFRISLHDTARDLYMRYNEYAFLLFKEHFFSLLNTSYKALPQSHINTSYFSRKDIDIKNIVIHLKKTSFEIHNQLRAFIFKEYQLPRIHGIRIKHSVLTQDFIGRNMLIEKEDRFLLSGIDGFLVIAYKEM